MIYIFGKLINPQEQIFLQTVLKESDRTARIKHFKAIYNTAKRNNTTLQNAHRIFENNKQYAERLNQESGLKKLYSTNIYGEIVKSCTDKSGRIYTVKCSDAFIKEITDGTQVNTEKPQKTFFKKVKSSIKYGLGLLKEALTVY